MLHNFNRYMYSCTYTARMSPTFNRSFALQHFKYGKKLNNVQLPPGTATCRVQMLNQVPGILELHNVIAVTMVTGLFSLIIEIYGGVECSL